LESPTPIGVQSLSRGCDAFGHHQVSEGNEDSGDKIERGRDLGVKKMAGEQ